MPLGMKPMNALHMLAGKGLKKLLLWSGCFVAGAVVVGGGLFAGVATSSHLLAVLAGVTAAGVVLVAVKSYLEPVQAALMIGGAILGGNLAGAHYQNKPQAKFQQLQSQFDSVCKQITCEKIAENSYKVTLPAPPAP